MNKSQVRKALLALKASGATQARAIWYGESTVQGHKTIEDIMVADLDHLLTKSDNLSAFCIGSFLEANGKGPCAIEEHTRPTNPNHR